MLLVALSPNWMSRPLGNCLLRMARRLLESM
jgi:hypothetical protein